MDKLNVKNAFETASREIVIHEFRGDIERVITYTITEK